MYYFKMSQMRQMKKTPARLKKERIKRQRAEIAAALDAGIKTRRKLEDATGINQNQQNDVFKADPVLYARYRLGLSNMLETAADNVQEIISDPDHPQHYQASVYVLKNYKNELDKTLEPKGSEEIEIEVDAKKLNKPTIIRFSRPAQDKD